MNDEVINLVKDYLLRDKNTDGSNKYNSFEICSKTFGIDIEKVCDIAFEDYQKGVYEESKYTMSDKVKYKNISRDYPYKLKEILYWKDNLETKLDIFTNGWSLDVSHKVFGCDGLPKSKVKMVRYPIYSEDCTGTNSWN